MKHNPGHGIESFCCSTKVDVAKFAVTAADTSPSVPSRDKTANGERYFYSPCGSKRCRLRNLIKKILDEARLSFIDSRGKRKSREMKRFEPLLFKLSRTKFDRYFFLELSVIIRCIIRTRTNYHSISYLSSEDLCKNCKL